MGDLGNDPGMKPLEGHSPGDVPSRPPRGAISAPTTTPGSTTLTPIEVERIRIGARARSDRVEVVDRHVTAHRIVHSDRTEEMGLALEYSQGPVPGET